MPEVSRSSPSVNLLRRGAFLTLFGVMCGHALLETARDALFLAKLPASQLGWVYLIIAVLALAITFVSRRARRIHLRDHLMASQFAAAIVSLAFVWLIGQGGDWLYYALYVWSGTIVSIVALYFWLYLGELLTIAESKRLFASIGIGGALGALTGFGLASVIVEMFPVTALLEASATAFALSLLGPLMLPRSPSELAPSGPSPVDERPVRLVDSIEQVLGHRYARRFGLLIILSSVTLTLSDYLFKSTLAENVAGEDLASWFARIYLLLNLGSLLLLAFVVTPVIRRWSLHQAAAVLPGLLTLAGVGILLGGGLLSVLALKAVEGTLRYSIFQTTRELLYLPVPHSLRTSLKSFVDIVGHNAAKVVASIAILQVVAYESHVTWLAAAITGLSALWIVAALRLREPYLDVFRESLNEGAIETRIEFPELDLASLETLIHALSHPERRHVIAAMEVLREKDRVDLIPSLVLYHPDTTVVSRALELFSTSGRTDYLPLAEHLLKHDDPSLRAASVRAIWMVAPDREQLLDLMASNCASVGASAAVGLIANGWASAGPGRASRALWEAARSGDVRSRLALAHAVGLRPSEELHEIILALREDSETEVRRLTAHAMCISEDPFFTPYLVDLLHDREIREQVRVSLLRRGDDALTALDARLSDSSTPIAVVRHIPRTLSRFASQRAVDILVLHLDMGGRGMVRFKVLRGLSAMLALNPELIPDRDRIRPAMERSIERAVQLLYWEAELTRGLAENPSRKTSASELLLQFLSDKRDLAAERLFRLLYLVQPKENFRRIWSGLQASDRRIRDHSEELLDNLLPADLGAAVLALVEGGSPADRLRRADRTLADRPLEYGALLAQIADDQSTALRGFALYHSAELMGSDIDPGTAGAVEINERRTAALDLLAAAELVVVHA
jgi:AAA family ATP:ADP antiporter